MSSLVNVPPIVTFPVKVAPPTIARFDPSKVIELLSSRAPEVPASTTLLFVRSETVAELSIVSPPEIFAPPSTSKSVVICALPVTVNLVPLNVKLPLSSRAPDVPAITTLSFVKSLTVAELKVVSPPDISAPPLPSIAPLIVVIPVMLNPVNVVSSFLAPPK